MHVQDDPLCSACEEEEQTPFHSGGNVVPVYVDTASYTHYSLRMLGKVEDAR